MVPASGGHLSGGWNQAGSFSYDLISSELLLEHDFFKIDINGWSPSDYEPSDGPSFESLVESRRIDIHNVHNGAGGSQQNICLDRADVTGLGDVIVPLHNNNVSCCDLQCQWRHFLTHRTPSACRPPPPPPPACASALCSQLPASWTRPALNTRQGQPLLHHT